jgi:acyl-CoA carboxylase epsilon subunit-like protein
MDEPIIVRGMPDEVELAALMAVLGRLAKGAVTPQVPTTGTAIWNEGTEYIAPSSWVYRG